MAPPSSQKGTGKKGGAGAMRQQQQRSRNTTPSAVPSIASLPPIESVEAETVGLHFEVIRNLTYEDMVDPSASGSTIPDSKGLDGILSRLQKLSTLIETRGSYCDRGMRLLAQVRKHRQDEERGMEEERRQKGIDDEERERKANKKKRKATENLAPQGGSIERSSPLRDPSNKPRKLSRDNDSASSSLSPVAPRTPSNMDLDDKTKAEDNDDDDDSSDDGRPPPPARPQANTFGEDPSTFPDPTVYEILPTHPGMSEEEKREIYSVATYPKSDLADIIAGDPPDKDFSSAKPSNQINFSTFSSYIDPYFRPFTEEDLAFLRERGDRATPFVMPKRGKKHYSEIWAEEDGAMSIDSSPLGRDRLPPNQPRGSIENMDDDVAETDKLSVGPLLSRLLQAMRPEHRAPPAEDKAVNGVNGDGDVSMNGVASFDFSFDTSVGTPAASGSQAQVNGANGLSNGINGTNGTPVGPNGEQALPPATFMPESNSESWKKASHPKLDYSQVDERIKQELRHIGFLPLLPHDPSNPGAAPQPDPATAADYDGHYDDEVAARLRLLQARLREQVLLNGARKARLTDLVKERMAHQEYQTILEDLDTQVQAAYLKRTRTMGKKPKKARPGAAAAAAPGLAAAAGMARPGIGDLTKTLMERRRRWIESIGTVFDDEGISRVPRVADKGSSIFKPGEMAELLRKEKDAWDEEVEEE
ncbi:putative transcriptional adapter 3 [Podospora aff. communis PSN243]|uniref:Transcriptional adapter 3 n=1 Tax=Podospora aff. communis PSN243 TaxID=3040156 RepID=A0AAV9G8G9_9PEZI|nr:putative transcriptional adapter 3 [Podospora aff. communis PSN243]